MLKLQPPFQMLLDSDPLHSAHQICLQPTSALRPQSHPLRHSASFEAVAPCEAFVSGYRQPRVTYAQLCERCQAPSQTQREL